jgi:C4-dicarboxylate-specific signal transduction histidine kinase
VHPEDRDAVRRAIDHALASAGDYEVEYRVLLAAGQTRWIEARGRPELAANGQPALMRGVVLDVTDRRRTELELQELRGQLAHAGRLSVLGQLAAALAHELNQPLGAILRNAEAAELFLQANPPALDEVRDIVADIRRDDQRAGAVIDRLRALMKRGALELRPLHLGSLVDEVATLARPDAIARRITVAVEMPLDLPLVRGDSVHLQQVLLNLLLNALDALNEAPPEFRRVTVRAQRAGPELVEVQVSDTGCGIPADQVARVFDPFFTTKPRGMGMGLSISRTIIGAHGGRIWAENRPEGGASFRFTLPLAQEGGAS